MQSESTVLAYNEQNNTNTGQNSLINQTQDGTNGIYMCVTFLNFRIYLLLTKYLFFSVCQKPLHNSQYPQKSFDGFDDINLEAIDGKSPSSPYSQLSVPILSIEPFSEKGQMAATIIYKFRKFLLISSCIHFIWYFVVIVLALKLTAATFYRCFWAESLLLSQGTIMHVAFLWKSDAITCLSYLLSFTLILYTIGFISLAINYITLIKYCYTADCSWYKAVPSGLELTFVFVFVLVLLHTGINLAVIRSVRKKLLLISPSSAI
jgi:hypothetical protein